MNRPDPVRWLLVLAPLLVLAVAEGLILTGLPRAVGVTIAVVLGVLCAGLAWQGPRTAPAVPAASDQALLALAAGLAHELGQPLSAARVGVEGLHLLRQLGREPSPEHLDRTLHQIGRSVLTMTAILDHLRLLAQEQSARPPVRLDLVATLRGLLAERELWLRCLDTRLICEAPPDPVLVLADPGSLRLIVTNLVRNAVEAVAVLPVSERQVRIQVSAAGSLEVANGGDPIPAPVLARLFDPFVTTKSSPGLRGLGLFLARLSAERLGAGLSVVSQPGSGTCFTLRCRLAEG